MIKETVKYPKLSKFDFIRLYCAMNFKKGYSPIIEHHELEKRLYKFYSLVEFRELFQDICPKKDYMNPENSYLELGTALNTAQLFGLLTPIHGIGETKSIVSCNEEISQEIISNTDAEIVNKIAKLFDVMFELDTNSKKKEDIHISNTNSVINNFMEKLDCGHSTYGKEHTIGTELALDEGFNSEQIESYKKLLKREEEKR